MTKRDDDDLREVFRRLRERIALLRASGNGRDRSRQLVLGGVLALVGLFIMFGGFRQGPAEFGGQPSSLGGVAFGIGAGLSGSTTSFVISLAILGVGGALLKTALTPGAPLLNDEVRCDVCGAFGEWWDGDDAPIARCRDHAPKLID